MIDTLEAMIAVEDRNSIAELVVKIGHFSPLANQIVAEYL